MRVGDKEVEIKLLVGDLPGVRRRLQLLGFRIDQPRSLEENVIYDTRTGLLRNRGALLRIRSYRGKHTLTYKERTVGSKRYKIRRETETQMSDVAAGKRILAGLGFQPAFRYEKYRSVYRAPRNWAGGEVMLDETPIGDYLELEGNQAWIRRLARRLGARPGDFINKDYGALYAEWRRGRGRKMSHMVFPRRQRRSA
jgi:adenylate cyclase class 2